MRRLVQCLTIVVAIALGAAAGLAWQRASAKRSERTVGGTLAQVAAGTIHSNSRVSGSRIRREDDLPLATRLERGISGANSVTRWLLWFEALEKAELDDYPQLVRLTDKNPAAFRLLAARWIDQSPEHLLNHLPVPKSGVADRLAETLFLEWPKRDPEGVIMALNKPEHTALRHYWGAHVAEALLENGNVERGLRLLGEWHINDFSPGMSGVAKWAAADPRHAAEFTMAHPAGHASDVALQTIGKEWAKSDTFAALEFAIKRPGEGGYDLASSAFKTWSETSLPAAAEWLEKADARARTRLSAAFVEEWAKNDTESALAWCEANLNGSALAQAVGGVLKGVAGRDVGEAAKFVASMNPSAARGEAAVAVADKWLPSWNGEKKAHPDGITWLKGLDGESIGRVLQRFSGEWADLDPETLVRFVESYPGEIPPQALRSCIKYMVGQNPVAAIEWTGHLPEGNRLAVGATAFSEWRSSQFDAAMKWLSDLPGSDIRRKPFFETAIRELAYDSRATQQLALMNKEQRAVARVIIQTMPLDTDRQARLLTALRSP
jgi:hypothetical protein